MKKQNKDLLLCEHDGCNNTLDTSGSASLVEAAISAKDRGWKFVSVVFFDAKGRKNITSMKLICLDHPVNP